MSKRERALARAHSPIQSHIGRIAQVERARVDPAQEPNESEAFGDHCSYGDAFEAECLLKNRGGLRDFYEERDQQLAEQRRLLDEVRARGIGVLLPADYELLLAWIDDRRERSADERERATLPRVGRAVTLTVAGAMFGDACREAETSRRTVEKHLLVYRNDALAWYRTCRRRERDRARRKRGRK